MARCDALLALRQPQGLRGDPPWRSQERLLGDVWDVRRGGTVTEPERELHLPSRLPAGQERPGRLGVAPSRRLGGGPLQRPRRHQGGHRGGGLGGSRRLRRGGVPVKKTHDYIHHYRGYWSDGGRCRIRIYYERWPRPGSDLLTAPRQRQHLRHQHGRVPGCGGNRGAHAAHAADMDRALPRARGRDRGVLVGEGSLAGSVTEVCLGGVWRCRVGSPRWSPTAPRGGGRPHRSGRGAANPVSHT